jgi:hypothetical protein
VSSKLDHETGIVTISAPVYSTMPVGHQLYTRAVRDGDYRFPS